MASQEMIVVDTSVWIEYFANRRTPEAEWLDTHLADSVIGLPELVLTEVLQGLRSTKDFEATKRALLATTVLVNVPSAV